MDLDLDVYHHYQVQYQFLVIFQEGKGNLLALCILPLTFAALKHKLS